MSTKHQDKFGHPVERSKAPGVYSEPIAKDRMTTLASLSVSMKTAKFLGILD